MFTGTSRENFLRLLSKKNLLKPFLYLEPSGGLGNQIYSLLFGYIYSKKFHRRLLVNMSFASRNSLKHKFSTVADFQFPSEYDNGNLFLRTSHPLMGKLLHVVSRLSKAVGLPFAAHGTKFADLIKNKNLWLIHGTYCDSDIASMAESLNLPALSEPPSPSASYLRWCAELSDAKTKHLRIHLRLQDIRTFRNGERMLRSNYFNDFLKDHGNKFSKILVFSDEPESVREFIDSKFEVVVVSSDTELTDLEEFCRLQKCNSILASDSTFSFWASVWHTGAGNIYYPARDTFRDDWVSYL